MANNIIFRTNLLRGAQGPQGDTGTAEAIPSDGVIWYDGAEAPAGFVETTAPSGISDIQTAVDVVSARVDEIEALPDGSTTADAELVDIRVGADGTTYDTAGNAVRGQVTALNEKIYDVNETQNYTISANSIVGTAEGNPITITDGGNCNVRELVATLSPTQAGSGDPSPTNVRAISGVSTLKIVDCGKNLFNENNIYKANYVLASDGSENASANYNIFGEIRVKPSQIYSVISTGTGDSVRVGMYDESMTFIQRLLIENTTTFTTTSNTKYIRLSYDTTRLSDVQVELGSSATTYEPYQGTTLSLSLGDTVYGGSVDLTSGVLTIELGISDFGDLEWTLDNHGRFRALLSDSLLANTWTGILCMSNMYKTASVSSDSTEDLICGIFQQYLYVKNSNYTDAGTFKSAMSGAKVVYDLATPTQTHLTPQSLRLLQGNNTLWANGSLEVEYVKDATIIINDILSRLEALEG